MARGCSRGSAASIMEPSPQSCGSGRAFKEIAMPARKFRKIGLALLLLGGGYAVVLGDCGLMEHAEAQQQSAPTAPPPTTPTQAPVVNPSNPSTVPQPSYKPLTPSRPSTTTSTPSTVPSSDVASPATEQTPNTSARSKRVASPAKARSAHHHRARFVGSTLGSYICGSSPCVRIHPWALYGYAAPATIAVAPAPVYTASALWWPGYYDYAAGQWGRGRPHGD